MAVQLGHARPAVRSLVEHIFEDKGFLASSSEPAFTESAMVELVASVWESRTAEQRREALSDTENFEGLTNLMNDMLKNFCGDGAGAALLRFMLSNATTLPSLRSLTQAEQEGSFYERFTKYRKRNP
jgi:hypothetical protein